MAVAVSTVRQALGAMKIGLIASFLLPMAGNSLSDETYVAIGRKAGSLINTVTGWFSSEEPTPVAA